MVKFVRDETAVTHKHMKCCLISLIFRKNLNQNSEMLSLHVQADRHISYNVPIWHSRQCLRARQRKTGSESCWESGGQDPFNLAKSNGVGGDIPAPTPAQECHPGVWAEGKSARVLRVKSPEGRTSAPCAPVMQQSPPIAKTNEPKARGPPC